MRSIPMMLSIRRCSLLGQGLGRRKALRPPSDGVHLRCRPRLRHGRQPVFAAGCCVTGRDRAVAIYGAPPEDVRGRKGRAARLRRHRPTRIAMAEGRYTGIPKVPSRQSGLAGTLLRR